MLNFLYCLYITIYLIKSITTEDNKTILDYRSKLFPYTSNNETLREVQLNFPNNTRILAYIDFKNKDDQKSYFKN